jgi:hypothetical protein
LIDPRYRRYIQMFLLVLPMTGIVTACNTIVARGLPALFTMGTLQRWGLSCLIAFPCAVALAPYAAKLTDRLVKPPSDL